jgi:hypothetical protein
MKPLYHKSDDGSILFEWIEKNHRFGISIEKDIKESSWYFIGRSGFFRHAGLMEGGVLPDEFLSLLKSTESDADNIDFNTGSIPGMSFIECLRAYPSARAKLLEMVPELKNDCARKVANFFDSLICPHCGGTSDPISGDIVHSPNCK